MNSTDADPDLAGPTLTDLAAIEAEWPLIEAELSLVDAEIRVLTADGGPSPIDWRRLRRAESRVVREVTTLACRFGLSPTAQRRAA